MAVTETRLLPKALVDDCHRALARLRFCRNVDRAHPTIPASWLPHPVDCDICTSGRRLDMYLDLIAEAIGNTQKVSHEGSPEHCG
jgi:hypothetical protein